MYVVATVFCLAVTFIQVHANSELQLNGTVAVVTGGAKGIGRSIAKYYLEYGAETVIILDKNQSKGLETQKEMNDIYGTNRTVFIYCDITKDLNEVSKKIINDFGYVDVLVNNAGILNEYDPETMIKTNVLGTMLWTQRFFEYMRKDKGGKGGTIMNVASISAYMRDPFMSFYKSSKFAMVGISVGLGHLYNFLTSGVRIFVICPGLTHTDMTDSQQMTVDEQVEIWNKFKKVAEWQSADDVGKAAALLYTTAETGVAYTIEGGASPVVAPDRVNVTVEYLNSL